MSRATGASGGARAPDAEDRPTPQGEATTALLDDAPTLRIDDSDASDEVHCARCSALLTAPQSVARGIGPVCAGHPFAETG